MCQGLPFGPRSRAEELHCVLLETFVSGYVDSASGFGSVEQFGRVCIMMGRPWREVVSGGSGSRKLSTSRTRKGDGECSETSILVST